MAEVVDILVWKQLRLVCVKGVSEVLVGSWHCIGDRQGRGEGFGQGLERPIGWVIERTST